MADYSYQRHPQDHGDSSYQPTYPPQAPAPPMDRGVSDVPPSYAFGSNYESGRGGGPMRGGPMRGGPMRGEPMRGCPQYQRGGFGRGGYPPQGPGGYNRTYQDVDKGPYHEREDWRQSGAGPSAPPQPYPQRPPQPRPRGSTIIVHNLPSHVTEQDLLNHFGSAGSIKMDPRTRLPEVWLGPQAGEARITFQDSQVAVNAVQWYNNGDFQGSVIHVEMDETVEPPPMPPSMGRMPMRGGPGGPGGPPPPRGDRFPPQRGGYGGMRGGRGDQGRQSFEKRDGDWICANPSCQNTNFKWRSECNRCRAPRPEGNGGDCPPDMNGDFGDGDRFNSRPPFPQGGRGGPRGGRGYPPRSMSGPPMGRGGFGGRGGPMREGRGMSDRGRGMSDRGRGGFGGRGGPNGNWRHRPY